MSGLLLLCTELTFFCIELPENYIYLNHWELGNFSMYIINDVNTVLALKKHLISFLDLKEFSSKYGLGDFDVELYHMAPKSGSLKSVSGEKILQSIQNSVKTIQICKWCLKQMNVTNRIVSFEASSCLSSCNDC